MRKWTKKKRERGGREEVSVKGLERKETRNALFWGTITRGGDEEGSVIGKREREGWRVAGE